VIVDDAERWKAADVKDVHALRMADVVKGLLLLGLAPGRVIEWVEQYYASFDASKRQKVRSDDCPQLGEKNAPVALVEFSDYQCPHCAAALAPLEHLVEQDRKGQVRLCSKYFPFAQHPRARVAAACAEYARGKGKFWELNKLLFANQETLEDENLKAYAKQVGLDAEDMLKQVYAGKFDAQVEKNRREGMAAGVESTPAIFVDGRRNVLPLRAWYLTFTVDDELQWQKEKGWAFAAAPQGRAKSN